MDIQKTIDSSSDLRHKKEVIENFIDQLTPEKEVNDDWRNFMKKQQRKQLDEIIAEENLKPEAIYQFVSRPFRDSKIVKDGTKITQKLSPISIFSKNKEND